MRLHWRRLGPKNDVRNTRTASIGKLPFIQVHESAFRNRPLTLLAVVTEGHNRHGQ